MCSETVQMTVTRQHLSQTVQSVCVYSISDHLWTIPLSLSLLCRELLMEDKKVDQEGLVEIISSLPPTLSADDVDDFFTLAHHYAHKTPQSFRKVGGALP